MSIHNDSNFFDTIMIPNSFGDILQTDMPNHYEVISDSDTITPSLKYGRTFFLKKIFHGVQAFLGKFIGGCSTCVD